MDAGERRRVWVRLWFAAIGDLDTDTLVGSFRAEPVAAERYRAAMRANRGLRVTVDPLPNPPPARVLPAEQLWTLTP